MFTNTLTNPSNTYESLTDSDMTYGYITLSNGDKIEMTDSNYSVLIESTDRNVRKQTFDLLYDTYANFKNTITSTYTGDMDAAITLAKLRGFDSARSSSLFADNVTPDIYDNLINTVNKNGISYNSEK